MTQRIYQVDAFATEVFSGNPAAVCPLQHWLPDTRLQQIAMENNLAETAFYVPHAAHYEIRWFTPAVEVDLCGHATLAAAFVLFHREGHTSHRIRFHSPRSGTLTVVRNADLLTLNFPADRLHPVALSDELNACFGITPLQAFKGKTDYLLVFDKEEVIKNLAPRLHAIASLNARGVIVTAPGSSADFVSRFFAPQSGVNEDPVTGSAHTSLTPYWAERLGKTELSAVQLSERKGFLQCRHLGDRVEISGQGKLYLEGQIYLE
ncbi:PhzF family phenazine biosynthesis protein [Niabella drilacis]|uniref:Phenazine biosynthesis protein PhzF family n=1 Tax=Niabella drilacis (strain DSM 25811 / CCM 8410 / CCUG 62505 / LMG 26954 / E90) TaxID=1285928 RepID=A0A1G6ILW8_NIADE|nr:PhzF family phenazine biosynthesis protein [Niabella drilacis]SDC07420.1 phenazine biosynthesis protein PhzF family [Niabella drilacis]